MAAADAEVKAEEPKEETKEEAKEEPAAEATEEAKPEVAKPKDSEEDAVDETRPKISPGTAAINGADATLNSIVSGNGKILMGLTEGGFQCLLAGARANVGVKSGRYMFEVRVLEAHRGGGQGGRAPALRFGLSTAGSSVFLGDDATKSIAFDSDGNYHAEGLRKKGGCVMQKDMTLALVVNLDASTPNANTVSLFRNGARVSEPMSLPDAMRGQSLFPTVTYKNVTLQVNFGATPLVALPFRCHTLGEAAAADVEVVEALTKSGKPEVVFPVGLPDAGYFDWVDHFLEQNPGFTELSDRKILEWATKSGLPRSRVGPSEDKPDVKFNIPGADDSAVKKLLGHIAPVSGKSFVVPELKANLTAADRKLLLQRFPASDFKRVAMVILGEPTSEHKERVQSVILAEKKSKAEAEHKRKVAEEKRKKLVEEQRKKKLAAAKKTEGEPEEEKAEEPAEEPMEVTVELTEEEKAVVHRKKAVPDMTEQVLGKSYSSFSVPSAEEGFDEIVFKWQGETDAAKALQDWIFAKKLSQRVENIQPGTWFKEESPKLLKALQDMRNKQTAWKNPAQKKKLLEERAAAKKKEAEEKGEEPKEDMEINAEDLDVSSVENVMDIGTGEPLFANFAFEDWVLLTARVELHLLLHTFKKDVEDQDRTGFSEKDLPFYYNRYFKKMWNIKAFATDKLEVVAKYIQDTFEIDAKSSNLVPLLEAETEVARFVKLAEEHRRERVRRLDAGDESAELKFPKLAGGGGAAPAGQGGARFGPAAGGQPRPAGLRPPASGAGLRPAGPTGGAAPMVTMKRPLVASAAPTGFVAKQPRMSHFGSAFNKK